MDDLPSALLALFIGLCMFLLYLIVVGCIVGFVVWIVVLVLKATGVLGTVALAGLL